MKKVAIVIGVLVAVFCVIFFFVWLSHRSDDVADGPKPKDVVSGAPTITSTRTLRGMPAEIDAAADGVVKVKEAGGDAKFHVVVIVSEKKAQKTPQKGESQRVRDARCHWLSLRNELDLAKRTVRNDVVQFGGDSGTTNCARHWEDRARAAMEEAWQEYQDILREEQ